MEDFGLNNSAYGDLMMLMDDSTDGGKLASHLVNNSYTTANPNGDAKLVWDRLEPKYRPSAALRY